MRQERESPPTPTMPATRPAYATGVYVPVCYPLTWSSLRHTLWGVLFFTASSRSSILACRFARCTHGQLRKQSRATETVVCVDLYFEAEEEEPDLVVLVSRWSKLYPTPPAISSLALLLHSYALHARLLPRPPPSELPYAPCAMHRVCQHPSIRQQRPSPSSLPDRALFGVSLRPSDPCPNLPSLPRQHRHA